ncbi:diacylglycerol/lipid kinase family protein [Streptomyces sp. NPDC058953]|uniref:diacylglycerol/lipid kinase family protein n=1 Tax=unclassified Streptomyces TaxID=2593676 RepID=UPI0036CD559F
MGRDERRGRARAADRSGPGARLSARLALLAAAGVLAVLVTSVGQAGLVIVVSGFLAVALCAVGLWWFLAHRGAVRALGAASAIAAPAALLVLFTTEGLWLTALLLGVCWAVTLACARAALRASDPLRSRRAVAARRPRRPVLIMNPRSGGGKVGRFGLAERARRLGARVILLEPPGPGTPARPADVAELARVAVAGGADLLGVAGGDGTQALVAAVAAEHELPFLVVPAGTRNHFALDLGLDRDDPARSLDALTDGEELRVDLGTVAGRAFVNTVSFGVYADVVQRPEYRDDKAGTALNLMPDLLGGAGVRRLDARADTTELSSQQAVLVSNNPYASPDVPARTARRPRLDSGVLGVLGIRVESAAQAADLAVRGAQSAGLTVLTARRVEVTADAAEIPVAVDGEALRMPTPVVCVLHPAVLRVLVPRDRAPAAVPAPPLDWRRLLRLAFGRAS